VIGDLSGVMAAIVAGSLIFWFLVGWWMVSVASSLRQIADAAEFWRIGEEVKEEASDSTRPYMAGSR
jgi:hypothetical protein